MGMEHARDLAHCPLSLCSKEDGVVDALLFPPN